MYHSHTHYCQAAMLEIVIDSLRLFVVVICAMGGMCVQSITAIPNTIVNEKFFELWNKEYRDGIKTRGDKIGMTLCIIKPLNDVRRKFSADHYAYW